MSIASEITRLQNAKASIKTAIEGKGVTVPSSTTLDGYAELIASISGGGGGLEYETGTYEPEEDISRDEIDFAKTHSTPPCILMIHDVTQTNNQTANSNMAMVYFEPYRIWGVGWKPVSTNTTYYASVWMQYASSTSSSYGNNERHLQYSSDNTMDTGISYPRYYVNTDHFNPTTNSTSRYWRAGRTYKWIAIWK